MKTILFINGGKVEKTEVPSQRFRLRLEWAIEYYNKNHKAEDIIFWYRDDGDG